MAENKHFPKIVLALTAIAVILCLLAIAGSGRLTELLGGPGVTMEYESKLFNTDEVMSVDIRMDEDDWNKMLSNAMSEEYYACDVVINGKKIVNVAIRPKGNTSLSAIAMDPDSNRFSLKLEFGHFEKGQTCYGLDKLILNNNYADATNMKEAVIYDMFQYIGAEASLWNYAKVSVNGEYWGLYLALEAVEDSFMLRNFGTQAGELYKPDSMEMGGGNSKSGSSVPSMPGNMPDMGGMKPPSGEGGFPGGGFDPSNMPDFGGSGFDPSNMPDMGGGFDPGSMLNMGGGGFDPSSMPNMRGEGFDPSSMPDMGSGGFDPSNMPDMGDFDPSSMGGGFSMGGKGANLNYTDDDLDSYSLIWEGEITGTGKADHRRVVTALKHISEGTELEKYLDVDNVLKYMAVHTFAVNADSLSGNMAHNYYLYEYDGQLNIFPWDYNLSLGGMNMGGGADATSVVNDAIDTPFSGTKFFDSLLENEGYRERYHAYLRQLADEYVNGGRFDEVYSRIRSQIDPLVETDPTAFYSYEEYQTAAEVLYETIKLRAQSINGQLDGTIPSTDAGQKEDSSALIDASHINVEDMGKFNMGGDFGDRSNRPNRDRKFRRPGSESSAESSAGGETEGQPGESGFSGPPEGFDFGGMPGGFGGFSGAPGQSSNQMATKNLTSFGICMAVALAALFGVKYLVRRRT